MYNRTIAKRLCRLRKDAGHGRSRLAFAIGETERTIRDLELGYCCDAALVYVGPKIAAHYGVDWDIVSADPEPPKALSFLGRIVSFFRCS